MTKWTLIRTEQSKNARKARRKGAPDDMPSDPPRIASSYSGAYTMWRERVHARDNVGENGVGDALISTKVTDKERNMFIIFNCLIPDDFLVSSIIFLNRYFKQVGAERPIDNI